MPVVFRHTHQARDGEALRYRDQADAAPGDRVQAETLLYKQHVAKLTSRTIFFKDQKRGGLTVSQSHLLLHAV